MPTVLLSAPYMLPFVGRFRPVFEKYKVDLIIPEVKERLSEEEILQYAGQFDGTICGDDRFSKRVLEACAPRLKIIAKWGTGIDSIDKQAANELGIAVRNTPNAFTLPVSDSVMGYILSFARRIPWMDAAMKAGEWKKIPGRSLSESVLGVVGVGNIGKAVIRRARAFGMRILATDIIPISPDFLIENQVEMVELRKLFEQADFISINCDLNSSSRHLVNAQTLAWVKPGAVLINTARGPIVDEKALIEALESGKLSGAGLDVFEDEPLSIKSPLKKNPNVLLAPHNSNSSPAAWDRVHWNTIRNLLDGLNIDLTGFEELKSSI